MRHQFEILLIELLIGTKSIKHDMYGPSNLSEKPTFHFRSTCNFSQGPDSVTAKTMKGISLTKCPTLRLCCFEQIEN